MGSTILVVVAHPDDEVLGCGGAIVKHAQKGDKVIVAILAEGVTSRKAQRDPTGDAVALADLAETARQANKLLGVSQLELGDFPDNRMDSLERLDIIKMIENLVNKYNPEIIYTHFPGDLNVDHQITAKAIVTACRPVPGKTVRTILFFEVPSNTEWQFAVESARFEPNWFIDISETITRKLDALQIYQSEMRDWPHARSLKAVEMLARWRGATIGVNAAEAFMLCRHICK
jgi:LmbE family N-acetylglucosaminyl deacetylase